MITVKIFEKQVNRVNLREETAENLVLSAYVQPQNISAVQRNQMPLSADTTEVCIVESYLKEWIRL